MASERLQRQIDRLLDEAEQAIAQRNWATVQERAQDVVAIDPENQEGRSFLAAAMRALESPLPLPASPPRSASSETSPALTPLSPASFANGRYQVKEFLGEGGKKRVYLAQDTTLDREVAFALIKTEGLDGISRTRVQREAQAMGRLGSHQHIVTVFDLGEEPGNGDFEASPYMVTELMGGGDVEDLIEEAGGHQLPLEQAVKIAQETCRGLDFAHGRGIVHRDLKPGNVWLTSDGVAKIGDFGLAVALDRSRLTSEGMMVGTVSYMPPEQAMGGEVTPQSDLYSLGAMLYEMVTGRPPFLGDDSVAIIGQHINTPPVAPTWHQHDCPRPLDALILRLLAKDPSERPESASDVLAALEAIDLADEVAAQGPDGAGAPLSGEDHSLDSLAGGVFVGRQQEMGELKACLEDSLSGRGRMVTLVGEPGIGKSRTAQELATYAGLRGAQVLWGRCYEEQGAPPYWPWVQAIRSYVREKDIEELRSEMGAGAEDIAEIVSDVRERLPGLRTPPLLEPEQARFRLFDSITAFLKSAGRVRPLVLVLDDLHWADHPSLLLLEFVARELSGSRLLLVGTYRDMELSRSHPLAQTLGELTRESASGGFQRVLLRGLSQEDVGRFIELVSGVTPPQGMVEAVHRQTEGNPLFVTEVVRLLVQEGEMTHTSEAFAVQEAAGASASARRESWSVRIPEGVREVIGRRLNRLSQRCNETLSVASVIGREFSLEQLVRLTGGPSSTAGGSEQALSEDRLLEVLEEALASRVIEELPNALGQYQFTHGLIQTTLSQELSTTRKVRLHAQIGNVLEELYGDRLESRLPELAHHFWEGSQAGGADKAIEYARRAGDRAIDLMGYEEAAKYYQMALQALELRQPANDAQRCELLLALGESQWKTGDVPQSMETYQEAASTARKSGASEYLALAAIGFEDARWRPGLPGEPAVALLEEARGAIGSEDSPLLARILGGLSRALAYMGEAGRAAEVAQEALDLARRVGDPQVLAATIRTTVHIQARRPELTQQRLDYLDEAMAIANRTGDSQLVAEVYTRRIVDLVELGEIPAADLAINDHAKLAQEMRQPHFLYTSGTWHAMRALLDGRFDEVETLAQQAADIGERLQADGVAGILGLQMFTLRREQGRLRELEPVIRSFVEQFSASSSWRPGLAMIYCELGRREEARDQFEQLATHGFNDIAEDALWQTCFGYLSEVCAFLGDDLRAGILYERLLPYRDRTLTVGAAVVCCGAAARYLGLLSAAMARWEDAQGHFEYALEMNSRMGAKPWLAHTQQQYATMLLDRGQTEDRANALSLLDQALAIATELGMGALTERILSRRKILQA